MKNFTIAAFTTLLLSSAAMADCTAPALPELPDGASSTMEDMLAGQKAVKTFQASNIEYMKCLEPAIATAEAALKDADKDGKDAAQSSYGELIDAYNSAVSNEEEVAGKFNSEIKAFKAANPS